MQAKYIILDTNDTYNNSFLLDGTNISNNNEFRYHYGISFIVNTQIEKYEPDKPEKEIQENIKENIDQYKTNEVKIELKYLDDDPYYTKKSFTELVKLVNNFNNMKEDEYIICEFRPIEKYYQDWSRDYIYMTNYGKIFLVIEDKYIKLYKLNWKIPENYIRYIYYYHLLYNNNDDYKYSDKLLSSICNLYRIYREEMIEEILEEYLVKNLSNLVISYV
jgi:hypothetical protein